MIFNYILIGFLCFGILALSLAFYAIFQEHKLRKELIEYIRKNRRITIINDKEK